MQTFRKSDILASEMPATWPKWLQETIKVAARIIKWLPGCQPPGQSGCKNHKVAARIINWL